MRFRKDLIGKQIINEETFRYYVIYESLKYGVCIESIKKEKQGIECEYIFFTEDKLFAYEVVHKMNDGKVTPISMIEILDDLIA